MKHFNINGIKPTISFILFLLIISSYGLFSQVTIISNTTINDCDFTFYDTGGVNASGYSANQDFTTTICPDVAGNAITLTWYTFTLGSGDYMDIFDGNSTSAPSLGHYTGNALNNLSAYASVFNTTGCLTVVFHSDANNNGVFNAAVACEIPCAHPVAGITTPNVPTIKLCKGQTINFDGALSSAAAGFNLTNYNWDFGDQNSQTGTNVLATHSYTQTGRFIASLEVTDNNGCKNKNAAFVEVLVETLPKYTIVTPTAVCLDEAFCIDASVVSPPLPAPTTNVFGSPIHVPDNVGQCFESTQFFNVFPVGAHLTNTNQLLSIYTNMSHTFVGDLIISIISPSGQSVILHQQGGGGADLGGDYYWTPNTTNPTWAATGGGSIPSGTYSSVQSLSGLIGSELNGTWTFKVCDMWAQDEGDVWAFGVNFDPSFYVDLQSLSPTIGMGADSSYISGPNMTSISTNGDHFCTRITNPANSTYTYTIKNSFGCTHDTTFSININPSPTASFTNNTVCQGVATNFTDASMVTTGNISSWNWDFTNDGTPDASTQLASFTYPSSNTYTASLTVSTANGCSSTATSVVNVYGHAVPNFTANNVCFGTTTTFVDNTTISTNPNTGSISSWVWDFNDASNAAIQSPTHTYSNIANNTTNSTYQVTLTVTTSNGCVDNITKPVIVYSNPTATFTSDEVCFNSPSHLLDASNGNGNSLTNYAWDFTNDNLADINGPNAINYTMPLVGNNTINYTVTTTPVSGLTCKTTTSQIVMTNPLPQAEFSYTNNCLNTQPNLFDGSLSNFTIGNITNYAWNYGDTQTDSSPLTTSTHAYNLPIQYNVTLTVTTNKGCENSVVKQVEVYPLPIISILSKPNVCFGSPTTFTANTLPNSGNVIS